MEKDISGFAGNILYHFHDERIGKCFTIRYIVMSKGQATLCVQSAQHQTRSSEIAFLRTVLVWLSTVFPIS